MQKSVRYLLLIIGFAMMFIINSTELLAQCAMCRASVETNINEDGVGLAAKLNTGILYLFVMPYLLAVIIGWSWYRMAKRKAHRAKEFGV